ncbi:MAG: roadblock/LC7 domain-containing protein [Cyanobacteria bacterium J06635_10]
MPINAGKIESILENFVSGTNDIQGATLVSTDGLSLASVLPNAMDDEKVSAMSAALLSLGERIGSELSRGSTDRIYVEGDKGYGVLTNCGDDAVLLVLASESAKQGLLMLEIRRLTEELKLLLM